MDSTIWGLGFVGFAVEGGDLATHGSLRKYGSQSRFPNTTILVNGSPPKGTPNFGKPPHWAVTCGIAKFGGAKGLIRIAR